MFLGIFRGATFLGNFRGPRSSEISEDHIPRKFPRATFRGSSPSRIDIPSYILRVILVFARGSAAVFVYDQPGAEASFAYQMISDRNYLQNPWQRGSETSGLAMLLVRASGAETFVPWTLLERAGVQRQTVIYPYEEMRVGVLLLKSVVCVFSIPYLTEQFPCCSPFFLPLSDETDEQE
uniref:Uncharacterized protein n=1 Tax=Brassica oleracea var. oleracea TaxID=109376 RepID=A0A0D3ACV0_BRAOL